MKKQLRLILNLLAKIKAHKIPPKIKIGLVVFLTAIVLVILGKSIYAHDNFLYPLNYTQALVGSHLAQTESDKAAVNLDFSHKLLYDFDRIQKKNYSDSRLVGVAKELGVIEHLAITHMDNAKKMGQLKKDQVHTLCEMLEQQQGMFAQEVLKSPPKMRPTLEEALNVTKEEVDNAMGW